jgi:hypothetical protein
VFFLVGFDAFALQDSRGSATRKERDEPTTTDKKELGAGIPRWEELEDTSVPWDAAEKTELRKRRRAAENLREGRIIRTRFGVRE